MVLVHENHDKMTRWYTSHITSTFSSGFDHENLVSSLRRSEYLTNTWLNTVYFSNMTLLNVLFKYMIIVPMVLENWEGF